MGERIRTSIIIIKTNEEQTKEAVEWINRQTVADEIETIILENENNKNYSSAAQALNDGAKMANGEFLFFMHQDIYLWDLSAIEKCVSYLEEHKDTVVGVAGVCDDKKVRYDMYQTKEKKRYAAALHGKVFNAISVDECFMGMGKDLWRKIKFDEKTCNNWHFYGADFCFSNTLLGGKNIVFPLEVCHESVGSPNSIGFKNTAFNMVDKYKGRLKKIYTTCINVRCSRFFLRLYFFNKKIKFGIIRILKFFHLYGIYRKLKNWIKIMLHKEVFDDYIK